MDDSTLDASTATRRRLLRSGLTLALAATALHAAPAWARDDDDDDDDEDDDNSGPGLGGNRRGREGRDDDDDDDDDARLRRIGLALTQFSAGLCRVSEAMGFTANSPGSDPLTSGRVRMVGRRNDANDDRIAVALRRAQPDVSYEVVFVPATGARESLGSVGPTNSRGDLVALTPTALSGAHRVGFFVLTRGGNDQFVSCLGD